MKAQSAKTVASKFLVYDLTWIAILGEVYFLYLLSRYVSSFNNRAVEATTKDNIPITNDNNSKSVISTVLLSSLLSRRTNKYLEDNRPH